MSAARSAEISLRSIACNFPMLNRYLTRGDGRRYNHASIYNAHSSFQCPCVIRPGTDKCVSYDSRYQAATLAEAVVAFPDLTLDQRSNERVSVIMNASCRISYFLSRHSDHFNRTAHSVSYYTKDIAIYLCGTCSNN